jgi:hypothetical protein
MSKLKPTCTCGEGPDIILSNEGETYILYDDPQKCGFSHGCSFRGSFDLNLQEAIKLRNELNMVILQVKELKQWEDEYFYKEEQEEQDEVNR